MVRHRYKDYEYQVIHHNIAGIAQLGERQTEDLKVTCSILVHRKNNPIPFSSVNWMLIHQ